jgi:hypothetical protein
MFAFLRRLFPERIFRRKLEPAAERRLRLAQARAEEAIIRAHVDNALMFVDTLAEDLTFDRAIDSYIREMAIPEPLASTVATRTLVVLGQDLVPYRRRAVVATRGTDRRRPAEAGSTTRRTPTSRRPTNHQAGVVGEEGRREIAGLLSSDASKASGDLLFLHQSGNKAGPPPASLGIRMTC